MAFVATDAGRVGRRAGRGSSPADQRLDEAVTSQRCSSSVAFASGTMELARRSAARRASTWSISRISGRAVRQGHELPQPAAAPPVRGQVERDPEHQGLDPLPVDARAHPPQPHERLLQHVARLLAVPQPANHDVGELDLEPHVELLDPPPVGRDRRVAGLARIAGLRLRRSVGAAGGHEAEDVARRCHVTSPAVRAPRRTASAWDRQGECREQLPPCPDLFWLGEPDQRQSRRQPRAVESLRQRRRGSWRDRVLRQGTSWAKAPRVDASAV
jgi:hypothetical protein